MLKDVSQTLTCPVCKSQVSFTVSGLLHGERFTCRKCRAAVSLAAESRQTVQSVADAFDHIQHHQPLMENDLPSFTGLHLEELIGEPLNAKEKAEAALDAYMDCYLKEHGFEGTCNSILIEMKLELPQPEALNAEEISGNKKGSTTFNIPLSAVIPLDSLGTEIKHLSK